MKTIQKQENNLMLGLIQNFCENCDAQDSFWIPTKSPLNLSPKRFRRAESASEVTNLEILHPDLEIKENHAYFFY